LSQVAPRPAGAPANQVASSPVNASAVQSDIVTVAERVGPAVVSIRTEQGLGSGVIYDASGLVLTNDHVVDGAREISVGLADGRRFPGKVLGKDAGFDLAVVKIDGQNLPAASLGDSSSLQVGQFVVAIGNPYGFDHTVTDGVVSALNRPIAEGQGSYAQPMIQTNAAINPGNSGGPLVDLQGNVVGITTLVAAPQGFPAQGLGFAVPINTARRIAPDLVADGRVTHSGQPYLGISLGDPSSSSPPSAPGRQQPRPSGNASTADHGALIARVEPNGPASQAGLRVGDLVTSFDGKGVYAPDDFLQNLVLHKPGDQVQLGISRGGQSSTLTVTVGEAPAR
jgi:S1-C subfamily serine protease